MDDLGLLSSVTCAMSFVMDATLDDDAALLVDDRSPFSIDFGGDGS